MTSPRITWRTSSRSANQGGECVQVAVIEDEHAA
jgi:hypothetical protein